MLLFIFFYMLSGSPYKVELIYKFLTIDIQSFEVLAPLLSCKLLRMKGESKDSGLNSKQSRNLMQSFK